MSVEWADLACETCGEIREHELHYAGRLLESTRCTVCGTEVEVTPRAMVPAYLRDLEQRVASKPRRMMRRAARDPVGFATSLPGAILRQPVKFVREFWSVLRP
jgi:hypothetical protein